MQHYLAMVSWRSAGLSIPPSFCIGVVLCPCACVGLCLLDNATFPGYGVLCGRRFGHPPVLPWCCGLPLCSGGLTVWWLLPCVWCQLSPHCGLGSVAVVASVRACRGACKPTGQTSEHAFAQLCVICVDNFIRLSYEKVTKIKIRILAWKYVQKSNNEFR